MEDWDGVARERGLPFIQGNAEFGARHPAPTKWCTAPAKRAEAGDTLLSVRAPVGATNRANTTLAIGRGVAAIRFKGVAPHFGWHALNRAKREFEQLSQGSTFTAISGAMIRGLELIVPPPTEQGTIAAILDAIDEVIAQSEEAIESTEAFRQALLRHLLTRGVPGRHTEWRQTATSGRVPACWQETGLATIVEIAQGQADPRDGRYAQLQFVAPDDIESATAIHLTNRRVDEAGAISGKYMFHAGDVLFSKIRPYLRKVLLAEEDGLCSADMYPLTPRAPLDPAFLVYVLLSREFDAYARTCSDRTGIPKMNRIDLLRYTFWLPPLAEQRRVADIVSTTTRLADTQRQHLACLRHLKSAVSDALLGCRLRVPSTGQLASGAAR